MNFEENCKILKKVSRKNTIFAIAKQTAIFDVENKRELSCFHHTYIHQNKALNNNEISQMTWV